MQHTYVTNVKYRYYQNKREDAEGRSLAMIFGYNAGDPLHLAFEGTVAIPQDGDEISVLEALFYTFNKDDRPDRKYQRSMCIGDVVILSERSDMPMYLGCFAVDLEGFVEIPRPQEVAA